MNISKDLNDAVRAKTADLYWGIRDAAHFDIANSRAEAAQFRQLGVLKKVEIFSRLISHWNLSLNFHRNYANARQCRHFLIFASYCAPYIEKQRKKVWSELAREPFEIVDDA